ncbi:hypothetical protein GY21_15860 [Cryobacterium roopkundense]|uniref:Peptide synthetase n=1 Tax=Cryobacterium roopkundense TaxID=1001240 RepID=A0A099J1R5_9MICO|nr:DUF4012 domain-containing protein [Cryobacterium roopkundense]KGJ72369.1 hypothetical protein GY21_15860 [Cryobacterium roopkundense]MBB5642377.1 hypothetical protein [Cryobacterium roopkundense]
MVSHHPAAPDPRRRARRRQMIVRGAVGVLVVVFAGAVWVGVRGSMAKTELESAIPLASAIKGQVLSDDPESAQASVEQLAEHASRAAALTSDPIWRAFEVVPFLGTNLTGVREIAAVVDDVSQNVVGPLATIAGALDPTVFRPVDGAINLDPLVAAQPRIASAHTALVRAESNALAIDTTRTLSVVRDAAQQLSTTVTDTAVSVGALNRAVEIVPAMLGHAGPRNYVLLFQNPAELRSTGGIPGALALIHTENGRIELAQQASSTDFPRHDAPVITLPTDTRSIYGDVTGQFVQNVNLTPNFALSGQIAQQMWNLRFGLQADGVISVDPVTLSYLLRATGPITLPTGEVLTADNAVQLLLGDAYEKYEPIQQNDFFAGAAAAVFTAVSGGDVDPVALIEALGEAGGEHRVLVWSAHPDEQAVLADTTIAGGLPVSTAAEKTFGVYLNDGTGSKMDLYLDVQYAVGRKTCRQDKRPTFGVDVTLTNSAPADAALSLPLYVTGGGDFGVPPGNIKTMVSAYGAPDMDNLGLTRDGAVVPYHPATDGGYPVSTLDVELAPGESTVLRFEWLGAEPFDGDLTVQSTPLINLPETQELAARC